MDDNEVVYRKNLLNLAVNMRFYKGATSTNKLVDIMNLKSEYESFFGKNSFDEKDVNDMIRNCLNSFEDLSGIISSGDEDGNQEFSRGEMVIYLKKLVNLILDLSFYNGTKNKKNVFGVSDYLKRQYDRFFGKCASCCLSINQMTQDIVLKIESLCPGMVMPEIKDVPSSSHYQKA